MEVDPNVELARNFIMSTRYHDDVNYFLALMPEDDATLVLHRNDKFMEHDVTKIMNVVRTVRAELIESSPALVETSMKHLPVSYFTEYGGDILNDPAKFKDLFAKILAIAKEANLPAPRFTQPTDPRQGVPHEVSQEEQGNQDPATDDQEENSGDSSQKFTDPPVGPDHYQYVPAFPSNLPIELRQLVVEPLEQMVGKPIDQEVLKKVRKVMGDYGLKLYDDGKQMQWESSRAMKLAEFKHLEDSKEFSNEYKEAIGDKTYVPDDYDRMLNEMKLMIDSNIAESENNEYPTLFARETKSIDETGDFTSQYKEEMKSADFKRLIYDRDLDNYKITAARIKLLKDEAEYIKKNKSFSMGYFNMRNSPNYQISNDDVELDKLFKEATGKDSPLSRSRPKKGETSLENLVQVIRSGEFYAKTHYTSENSASWKSKDVLSWDAPDVAQMRTLFETPYIVKLDLAASRWVIRDIRCTAVGVLNFLSDNSLEQSSIKECCLGAMIAFLVETGAIKANSSLPPVTTLVPSNDSQVKEEKFDDWKKCARILVKSAFYFESQGSTGDGVRWFESFKNVYGDFISETNFIHLMKLLINSPVMDVFSKYTTIKEIQADNNVLKYRLSRLSSPQLVHSALACIRDTPAARFINLKAAMDYCKFSQAGLIAQIASGPLKHYCKGNIDPLDAASISDDAVIADLAPIESPPYDDRIIKQTVAVCEVFDIPTGKWYQGNKALQHMDARDVFFKKALKSVKKALEEKMDAEVEAITREAAAVSLIEGDQSVTDAISDLLTNWRKM